MQALAIGRNWRDGIAWLLVLAAIVWYTGRPGYNVTHVSVAETIALIDSGALVIDVRAAPGTTLPGALMIPLEVLAARLAGMKVEKAQPIVVYCGNGSSLGPRAADVLAKAGYTQVVNLKPGIEGWRGAGLPVRAG